MTDDQEVSDEPNLHFYACFNINILFSPHVFRFCPLSSQQCDPALLYRDMVFSCLSLVENSRNIMQRNGKLEHTANSAINVNVKHAYCSANRMEEGERNPYSWHNIISMSLLENNSICKDGGGIHYQQLGWNDNTHYTAISLHKAANGSNHSTLINKTLSFVSTWRASSIFHWDSHSWARQHGSNIFFDWRGE